MKVIETDLQSLKASQQALECQKQQAFEQRKQKAVDIIMEPGSGVKYPKIHELWRQFKLWCNTAIMFGFVIDTPFLKHTSLGIERICIYRVGFKPYVSTWRTSAYYNKPPYSIK